MPVVGRGGRSSSTSERPSPIALLAYGRVCPNVLTIYSHCLLHVVAAAPVLVLKTRARPHLRSLRGRIAGMKRRRVAQEGIDRVHLGRKRASQPTARGSSAAARTSSTRATSSAGTSTTAAGAGSSTATSTSTASTTAGTGTATTRTAGTCASSAGTSAGTATTRTAGTCASSAGTSTGTAGSTTSAVRQGFLHEETAVIGRG
jgi:hypothetical protein